MNKKLLLIGAIFVVVVVVAVVLFGNGGGGTAGPTVSPTLAPPAPTSAFVQPQNVVFSFASPPTIPTSLPTYTYQPPILTDVERMAAKAAATLGLSATPSALTRGGSYTKTWSRLNEASLRVSQTAGAATISFTQSRANQSSGLLTPAVAVQQFLLAIITPTTNLSVRANGTSAGPFDGLLVLDTPPPTSYTNYFYSYVISSYPVLSSTLDVSPVSVIVDSGGIVRSANIVPPPAAIQTGNPIALLTRDQVLASLSAGRGTLLYTNNSGSPDQGAVPNFSKFIIKDTKIVYAPQGNLLLPALYITGTGTSTSGATQEATIFLWLSPESSIVQP